MESLSDYCRILRKVSLLINLGFSLEILESKITKTALTVKKATLFFIGLMVLGFHAHAQLNGHFTLF